MMTKALRIIMIMLIGIALWEAAKFGLNFWRYQQNRVFDISANGTSKDMTDYLKKHHHIIDKQDSNGHSALFYAILNNNPEMVRVLIDNGANVNIIDNNSSTPLLSAILLGNPKIENMLLDAGANPNYNIPGTEISPLSLAVIKNGGDSELIETLIAGGADVLKTFDNNTTLLMIALRYGANPKTVKTLVETGCDINAVDDNNSDVLSYALTFENPIETIKYLVNQGANVNFINDSGNSTLDTALKTNQPSEIIEHLKKAGAQAHTSS